MHLPIRVIEDELIAGERLDAEDDREALDFKEVGCPIIISIILVIRT